jgi:hypothetical protein
LRAENPTVDSRTTCLPIIRVFKIPYAIKLRLENLRQKQQIRPKNHGLLVSGERLFTFPCWKKLRPENPASNFRYNRKIRLPVTAETAGKSRQVTTDTAGKSGCQ